MSKAIHFKSCFICEVNIDDNFVEIVDSGHLSFFIDKNDNDVMAEFKAWFKDVYKACVPQTLTVIQYEPVHDDESNGMKLKVIKLMYNKKDEHTISMICENKEAAQ